MFSNLIESGSHATDLKRKGRFFLGTTLFYGLLLAATGVGSIYAYNVRLDYNPDYEVLALMRFPPAESRGEQPRREQQRAASGPSRVSRVATRTEISMNTPYRGERIASASTPEVGPRQNVRLGSFNSIQVGGPAGPGLPGGEGPPGGGGGDHDGPAVTEVTEPPPPRLTPTPAPTPAPRRSDKPVALTSSIIAGKTLAKPAPPYPAVARAAGVQGLVAVQILVDEQGRVVSAKAASGNPLLQQAAVQAAYKALFSPTVLGGQPVKVTGSITYNFVLR
ncbi:MAG TPA: energy transducer TonB [Pyrinomonadaceae bacterium]